MKSHIFEMVNYYKEDLNLPVNVWIDESEWYKKGKHSKRIKFQINYGDKIIEELMCPMMLDGEIPYKIYKKIIKSKNWEIKSRDLEKVRCFVLNNFYALDALADQKIKRKFFDEIVIIGGNLVDDTLVDEQIKLVDDKLNGLI